MNDREQINLSDLVEEFTKRGGKVKVIQAGLMQHNSKVETSEGEKRCAKCRKSKPTCEFVKSGKRTTSYCRKCNATRFRELRHKDIEATRAKGREEQKRRRDRIKSRVNHE